MSEHSAYENDVNRRPPSVDISKAVSTLRRWDRQLVWLAAIAFSALAWTDIIVVVMRHL